MPAVGEAFCHFLTGELRFHSLERAVAAAVGSDQELLLLSTSSTGLGGLHRSLDPCYAVGGGVLPV